MMSQSPAEQLVFVGVLEGHKNWVTSIRTPSCDDFKGLDGLMAPSDQSNIVISGSRDKSVMVWRLEKGEDPNSAGIPVTCLTGHDGAVSDLSLSSNSNFVLSGSWDKTMRLWDLSANAFVRAFVGHEGDVFSVALSPDSRQIVSGSRDRTIKLWNSLADCKFTLKEHQHTDWVSCVRFSPATQRETLIVSCSWDKIVKVWELGNCSLKTNLIGHTSSVHSVTISPDGSLCASGGKDGVAMLWDVNEGKHLYSLEANATITALCFSPCNYWLCATTENSVKIWNLEDKLVLAELTRPSAYEKKDISSKRRGGDANGWCTTLTWSADGQTLFVGATDGRIYVYEVQRSL